MGLREVTPESLDAHRVGKGETLTIRTSYDHEGCFARIYDSNGQLWASAYSFAHGGTSWEQAKEKSIADAKAKVSLTRGPQPEPETIPWTPEA